MWEKLHGWRRRCETMHGCSEGVGQPISVVCITVVVHTIRAMAVTDCSTTLGLLKMATTCFAVQGVAKMLTVIGCVLSALCKRHLVAHIAQNPLAHIVGKLGIVKKVHEKGTDAARLQRLLPIVHLGGE